MWVTVWYGDEFQAIASDEYVSLDTPLCDLTTLFPESIRVTISGDDFDAN